MAGSGFSRNNTPQYGGLYKTPAGKTTAAAGAGGAIPRVQAPAVSVPNDPPVDLAGLGGLLYFMGQGTPAYMSVNVPDPRFQRQGTAQQAAEGAAQMTPEDKAAMERSGLRPEYGLHLNRTLYMPYTGEAVPPGTNPTYYDRNGNTMPGPDAGWLERTAYNLKKWF